MKQQLSYIITTEDALLSWRHKTVMAPSLQHIYSSESSKQYGNTFRANVSDIANSVALFCRSLTSPACPFDKSYIEMTVGEGRWWMTLTGTGTAKCWDKILPAQSPVSLPNASHGLAGG
jgi:hypothetical protein